MSDIVGTSTASFCRGEDHSRSVAVPVRGVAAVQAPEGPFGQPEARLFLATLRAGHRGAGGRDQHHLAARPQAMLDKFPLGCTDRCVGGFARHGGLGQEFGPEVLHGDQLVVVNDPAGPQPRRVSVLPGGFLLDPGSFPLGAPVPGRLGMAARPTAAGHAPLGLGQVGGAPFPVPLVRQVIGRVGGDGRGGNAPVNADRPAHFRSGPGLAGDDKRGVPVTKIVLADTHAGRRRRQFAGPHDGDAHPTGQAQPPVMQAEPAAGVLQRGQRQFAVLDHRLPPALHRVGVAERLGVGPQRLLLGDLRSFPQPGTARPSLGEKLAQLAQRRPAAGLLLVHGLVPQPAAPVPLSRQRPLCPGAGPQAVGVAHDLAHDWHPRTRDRHSRRWPNAMPATSAIPHRPYLPTAKATGFPGGL